MTLRVAVADDQPLVRAGISGILDAADDLEIVGEAVDGASAVELAAMTEPDVLLMDVRMPGMDGIEATRTIVGRTRTRVIVLTTFDLDEYLFGALQAGASGFLLKDTPAAQLQEAVRIVASGEALLAPGVTRRVIDRLVEQSSTGPPATNALTTVTRREREVLDLIAQGLSNAEIAAHLHITHGTVKTHVSSLLGKANARDRIQLAILAHTTR
ncbi:response regulator transcription factor [Nocardioides sp.]|uniref:response regulator transcription factor n=1 Tax=Nocardioides sp. TaxID=35761 RepID=UPI002F41CC64